MPEGMQLCIGCGAVCSTNLVSCPHCGLMSFWKVGRDQREWRYSWCHVCHTPLPWLTPPEVCPNPACRQPKPLVMPYNVLPGKSKIYFFWKRNWTWLIPVGLAFFVFRPCSFLFAHFSDDADARASIEADRLAPPVPSKYKGDGINIVQVNEQDQLENEKKRTRIMHPYLGQAATWKLRSEVCSVAILLTPITIGFLAVIRRWTWSIKEFRHRYL